MRLWRRYGSNQGSLKGRKQPTHRCMSMRFLWSLVFRGFQKVLWIATHSSSWWNELSLLSTVIMQMCLIDVKNGAKVIRNKLRPPRCILCLQSTWGVYQSNKQINHPIFCFSGFFARFPVTSWVPLYRRLLASSRRWDLGESRRNDTRRNWLRWILGESRENFRWAFRDKLEVYDLCRTVFDRLSEANFRWKVGETRTASFCLGEK